MYTYSDSLTRKWLKPYRTGHRHRPQRTGTATGHHAARSCSRVWSRTPNTQRYAPVSFITVHYLYSIQPIDRGRALRRSERAFHVSHRSPYAQDLRDAVEDSLDRLLGPSLESEILAETKARADASAVDVFAENLALYEAGGVDKVKYVFDWERGY